MAKLNTYYERSAESDAHIMAMGNVTHLIYLSFADLCLTTSVLKLSTKMAYFKEHWEPDLVSKVEDAIQAIVSSISVLRISLICIILVS